jgi:hypothetical protein
MQPHEKRAQGSYNIEKVKETLAYQVEQDAKQRESLICANEINQVCQWTLNGGLKKSELNLVLVLGKPWYMITNV